MKIQFFGAAREVTGSKHLITTQSGKRILLDCGMFQGKGQETDAANRRLGFDASQIDYLILSHAHIDHSGLIPYLINQGYKGNVICTHATRDLCSIMLADSGHIQEMDTKTNNKKRERQNMAPLEPLYTSEDARNAMDHFVSIANGKPYKVCDEVTLTYTNNGHILGSSAVNLIVTENNKEIRFCYTGDIGRLKNSILKAPEPFPQADYIIAESTYGDRLHGTREEANKKLLEVAINTCQKKKGKLIIPSFSVGRTQEIVYSLQQLFSKGWLPKVPIYVDSPLSVNATNIMRMHPEGFNNDMRKYMETDPDPFGFNGLNYVMASSESKKLNNSTAPCIIISASGMAEAGRIKHHLANNIGNPKNTVLFVGYCEPKTLGARLKRGETNVSIHGNPYTVKCDIESLDAYSAHGDYAEMIVWLSCQDKSKIKKMLLVHGEAEAQIRYKQILEENHFSNIEIPEWGQEVELN